MNAISSIAIRNYRRILNCKRVKKNLHTPNSSTNLSILNSFRFFFAINEQIDNLEQKEILTNERYTIESFTLSFFSTVSFNGSDLMTWIEKKRTFPIDSEKSVQIKQCAKCKWIQHFNEYQDFFGLSKSFHYLKIGLSFMDTDEFVYFN